MADKDSSPTTVGTEENKPAPVSSPAGNAAETGTKAPSNFKYKSQEEAEKAYSEIEKKFGEHSKEVEEARKMSQQYDVLVRAIWSDPELYRNVEQGIQKYVSGGQLPDTRTKPNEKKGGGEAHADKVESAVADVRVAEENRILGDFYSKYGYNNLSAEDRKGKLSNLSVTLAEIVDPQGKRPVREILNSIPLSKLPRYLENAHFIANRDMYLKQAKDSAILTERENENASIGSFAAANSAGHGESVTLTQKERETAAKMHVSEEAYKKRKSEIQKEANRFR